MFAMFIKENNKKYALCFLRLRLNMSTYIKNWKLNAFQMYSMLLPFKIISDNKRLEK